MQIFTIIFVSAVVFGLIAHPNALPSTINSVGGLVRDVRGS